MTAPALDCRAASEDDALTIALSGDWLLENPRPGLSEVLARLRGDPGPSLVAFDTHELGSWDTGLMTPLVRIRRRAEDHGVAFDASGLPAGAQRLLDLAFAVKEREEARRRRRPGHVVARIGSASISVAESILQLLAFAGRVVLSLGRFATGRATYLRSDVVRYVQSAGADALPIAGLLSFLVGMIFAFVGVVQLRAFAAGIYTADLVGIAVIREMAPIMTAVIMAGRTGASYAAQIGTMRVNEEVDAMTTMGIHPIDFLVVPRLLALTVMMPLLAVYSGAMGIAGGTVVGTSMLHVSAAQYLHETALALGLGDVFCGVFKAFVFGALVAISGCMQGLTTGTSAQAVGESTTRSVVMSIVLIVVSASIMTLIFTNLGI